MMTWASTLMRVVSLTIAKGGNNMNIYLVKAWIDDGWQRFTIEHKVLANNIERAKELVKQYWIEKDHTNIVQILDAYPLKDFIEGVIC